MNALVVGGGSSLLDIKKLRENFTNLTVLSSSTNHSIDGVNFYRVNWEESIDLGQISSVPFDIVYFLNGAWLPGKLRKLNKDNLIKLLDINVFTPFKILCDLHTLKLLSVNCKVVLVSSKVADSIDYSAPEYSLAKICAEEVFKSFCELNKYRVISKRFGFIDGSAMHKLAEKRYGVEATSTIEEVRTFLEEATL